MSKAELILHKIKEQALSLDDIKALEKQILAREIWVERDRVSDDAWYLITERGKGHLSVIFPCYLFYSVNFNFFMVYDTSIKEEMQRPTASFDSSNYGTRYKIAKSFSV